MTKLTQLILFTVFTLASPIIVFPAHGQSTNDTVKDSGQSRPIASNQRVTSNIIDLEAENEFYRSQLNSDDVNPSSLANIKIRSEVLSLLKNRGDLISENNKISIELQNINGELAIERRNILRRIDKQLIESRLRSQDLINKIDESISSIKIESHKISSYIVKADKQITQLRENIATLKKKPNRE